MLLGERGAGNRDNVLDPDPMERENIKVPFHKNHGLLPPDCFLRMREAKESNGFIVERAIGGIDVLGIILAQRSSAKTDQVPLRIAYREHNAIAKSIVDPLLLQLLLHAESRSHDFRSAVSFFKKMRVRGIERIRCKADCE